MIGRITPVIVANLKITLNRLRDYGGFLADIPCIKTFKMGRLLYIVTTSNRLMSL